MAVAATLLRNALLRSTLGGPRRTDLGARRVANPIRDALRQDFGVLGRVFDHAVTRTHRRPPRQVSVERAPRRRVASTGELVAHAEQQARAVSRAMHRAATTVDEVTDSIVKTAKDIETEERERQLREKNPDQPVELPPAATPVDPASETAKKRVTPLLGKGARAALSGARVLGRAIPVIGGMMTLNKLLGGTDNVLDEEDQGAKSDVKSIWDYFKSAGERVDKPKVIPLIKFVVKDKITFKTRELTFKGAGPSGIIDRVRSFFRGVFGGGSAGDSSRPGETSTSKDSGGVSKPSGGGSSNRASASDKQTASRGDVPGRPNLSGKDLKEELLEGQQRLYHKYGNTEGVDAKLIDVLKDATKDLPPGYRAEMISGKDARRSGTKNHPGGIAVDVVIVDDKGNQVPHNRGGPGMKIYEKLHQSVVERGRVKYPNEKWIWGGTWISSAAGPGDPMHYQRKDPSVRGSSQSSGAYNDERGAKGHVFEKYLMTDEERRAYKEKIKKRATQEKEQPSASKEIPPAPTEPGKPREFGPLRGAPAPAKPMSFMPPQEEEEVEKIGGPRPIYAPSGTAAKKTMAWEKLPMSENVEDRTSANGFGNYIESLIMGKIAVTHTLLTGKHKDDDFGMSDTQLARDAGVLDVAPVSTFEDRFGQWGEKRKTPPLTDFDIPVPMKQHVTNPPPQRREARKEDEPDHMSYKELVGADATETW